MRPRTFAVISVFVLFSVYFQAQTQPASDPQALSYAAQSIAALTGGTNITDVTLTGSAIWNGTNAGTATLMALGTGESRMDLAVGSGTRTEIRDVQTGTQLGKWINPDGSAGPYALHNCWTDAVWFFPPLGSLAAGTNVVLSYIGQENRNGSTVQHVQSYVYQPNQTSGPGPNPQQLSTMDFYLDASTLLPVAVGYSTHSDNDAGTNLSVEIDFTQYQTLNGVNVPTSIKRYLRGTLEIDITVQNASLNTGPALANFAVN